MKIYSYFILYGLLFVWVTSVPSFGQLGLKVLPKGRPFKLTFADPREIQMSLEFLGDTKLHASIGNYFSLLSFQPVNKQDWQIHFGLEGGGFFTMRQEGSRFPLETADGLVGIYLEGSYGDYQAQIRYTHISAHLADGSLDNAITYSRETIFLRGAYAPSDNLHLYAGPSYVAHKIPWVPGWGFQWGGTYFLSWGLNPKILPYLSTDWKLREETDHHLSFEVQLGFALNNPPRAYRSFRFFYAYYNGADPRGQFFRNLFTSHSLGIEMQI